MQIAIVSTDGKNVNDHFGKAERFLIYEITDSHMTKLAERKVAPFSSGDSSHRFNSARFEPVAEALAGCAEVYITKIGEKPRRELEKRGITPVIYEGAIDAIIAST